MLYRVRGHADLVAELVCSLGCLHVYDTPELGRAWAYLSEVQCPDGHVPGPPDVVHPDMLDEDDDARNWIDSYHTTIVAALAGLVADGQEAAIRRTPARAVPAPGETALMVRLRNALHSAVLWIADQAQGWTFTEAVPTLAAAGLAARRVGASPRARRDASQRRRPNRAQ